MGRIQAHRGEQRLHLVLKIGFNPLLLGMVALVVRQDMDAVFGKGRQQRLVVQLVLLIDQGMGTLTDAVMAVRAEGTRMLSLARSTQMQFGTHFKKLVQIGRHDAQIAQTLEQRHIGAPRPVQHAQVKAQDAFVAVKQWQVVGAVWGRWVHSGSFTHSGVEMILSGTFNKFMTFI